MALPARLREPAERLPWTLGLTSSPDGGWGDFVRLHPNRDLPVYAAQARDGGYCLGPEDLARYVRAHHFGGFTWLLRDRMKDGQVAPDEVLRELSEIFGRRWRDAIADATGEEPLTDLLCRRSTALWRRGTGAERTALAAGSVPVTQYTSLVREKLSWIAVPSQALLLVDGDSDRLESFLAAYDLFLLGLQAIDDVSDREQDRALHGCDVADRARLLAGRAAAYGAEAGAAGGGGGRRRRVRLAGGLARRLFGRDRSWSLGGDIDGGRARRDRDRRSDRRTVVGRDDSTGLARPPAAVSPCLSVAAASYGRELEWNEPPSACECRYARWTVVRAAGTPAAAWWPLASIGRVDLHLAPPGTAAAAAVLSATPLVAAKRGRRGSGDYVGVDGHVGLGDGHIEDNDNGRAGDDPARPHAPMFAPALLASDRIRVAIVDVSFDNVEALDSAAVDGPLLVGLPGDRDAATSIVAPGHGTMMAGVVLAEAPDARIGLFQIASFAGAARPYLAPADLAAAVAVAVEGWRADVVLIAMSDGAWGTPGYLGDVLREAARCGRGGRGAAIFCSVGDPSRNHVRKDDSAVLGADDLASQPWVQAIAACDQRGRWYRTYAGYGAGAGAAYNRLGPAVALAASGEPRRWSEHIAADDSSQASALAAAAAARVLAANPELSAVELRALLALTADVPADVDGGSGLAAGLFDARDRLGHSFKLGHGVVNVRAASMGAADPVCLALLATRPVPDPDPTGGPDGRAFALARAWRVAARARGPPPRRDSGARLPGRRARWSAGCF